MFFFIFWLFRLYCFDKEFMINNQFSSYEVGSGTGSAGYSKNNWYIYKLMKGTYLISPYLKKLAMVRPFRL